VGEPDQLQVLPYRQPRIPGRHVGDEGDRSPERRIVARRGAEHRQRPGRRPVEAGQAGQQRRPAGPVDPGDGGDLALGHGHVHIIEHDEPAVAHAHAANHDRRLSHALTVSRAGTAIRA
jgi:hypothetical protein